MRINVIAFCFLLVLSACKLGNNNQLQQTNTELASLVDNYYEKRLSLYPLEATAAGDNRFNDQLYIDFTDSYRQKLQAFYKKYQAYLATFERENLNDNDKITYDILKRDIDIALEGLQFNDNLMPLNQFSSFHLTFAQLGSGSVMQPFNSVKDYDNWLQRMQVGANYLDSAIVYFKKGIAANTVLPKALVVKMIPQMQSMVVSNVTESIFYGPIKQLPDSFPAADKQRLTQAYTKTIQEKLIPAFQRLGAFLQNEYLPKSRNTTGINGIPNGDKLYAFCIKTATTTQKTADEIYQIGLSEVARIRSEMTKVQQQVGFKGTLLQFFEYMRTDKQFKPYKQAAEIITAFNTIHQTMQPNLQKMFGNVPKTPFKIRQTEAFRAATASAEYMQGSADGSRPGIFYVPIVDATQFNTTSGMESLFLHEAIPGHHYQISIQQENTALPKFRRFGGNNAYAEGWALYCESLGKELGLYTNPYQYMGALGDEMHRAIRLVVDAGMHSKNMTREEAIAYMMENEPISEDGAVAEIERYMSIPGQALGYKIGALKIKEMRTKYEKQLGKNFNIAKFHDAILIDGNMPLDVLETKMDAWAAKQK
ncbi:MAG: DUF885 domain-containing protein [Chitinophagaceae bacterium]